MTQKDLEQIINADKETLNKVEQILKEAGYQTMSPQKIEGTVVKDEECEMEKEEKPHMKEEDEDEEMEKGMTVKGEGSEHEAMETPEEEAAEHQEKGMATMSDRAVTALKAIKRIHAPFAEEISPEMVSRALASDASGGFYAGHQGAEEAQHPKPVSEQDHEMAHDHALKAYQKAYGDHVKKLGYRMYPDAQIQMKSEGKTMEEKMEKSSVKKEDLLASLPKEARGAVEAIFKQNQALEAIVKEERELRLNREFQEVAKSYKHIGLPTEELADVLKKLATTDKTTYEKVEKWLRTADEQIGHGKLFSEVGSNIPSSTMDAEKKIDAAVNEIVKKSTGVTKEQAYVEFIGTPEGQKLYEQFKATRKGGI